MAQEIIFSGDELELLNALDRSGCVLTDDGKFYCNLENDKLPFNSRLPVCIRGTYASAEVGWKIPYTVAPSKRTIAISGIFAGLFLVSLFTKAGAGTVLFAILSAAMVVNFLGQKKACQRRFENMLLHGRDMEL